jgi:hypothetical protein
MSAWALRKLSLTSRYYVPSNCQIRFLGFTPPSFRSWALTLSHPPVGLLTKYTLASSDSSFLVSKARGVLTRLTTSLLARQMHHLPVSKTGMLPLQRQNAWLKPFTQMDCNEFQLSRLLHILLSQVGYTSNLPPCSSHTGIPSLLDALEI